MRYFLFVFGDIEAHIGKQLLAFKHVSERSAKDVNSIEALNVSIMYQNIIDKFQIFE